MCPESIQQLYNLIGMGQMGGGGRDMGEQFEGE